jgi:hypothetical protein
MKNFFLLISLLFILETVSATDRDTLPFQQTDVQSIDATIKSLYDVISGPAGQKRNWDRMRSLFSPEARLIATGKRQDGSMGRRVMSVEEYIKLSGPVLEKDGFFETEISRKTDQYGAVVQVFSTYESKRTATDPKPFMRGINSIQLWNDGKRWWVLSVFWQAETEENPIPEKYLQTP